MVIAASRRVLIPLLLLIACVATPRALAAQTGTIVGTVSDAPENQVVPGARVSVQGTDLGSLSQEDGSFVIRNVPAGAHVVRASLIGYGIVEREVRVGAEQIVRLEVELTREALQLAEIRLVVSRGDYVADQSVSATKTSTPLLETPQSVSVLTRERLDVQGTETQSHALRYTAGVQGETYGADMLLDWTQIRGFQQYGQNLFRDGLQFRSAGQSAVRLNPWGAERIEVVRGPASVLYGQSSVGGLVNFVTKRPTAYPIREVRMQAGSFGRLQGVFDIGGSIDDDNRWLFRVTGLARESEAQVAFSNNDQRFLAPALTWRPGDRTSLTFLADWQHDDAVRGTSFLPAAGTLEPNPNGRIPVDRRDGEPGFDGIDRHQYSTGYLFEHTGAGAWTLRSRARYAAMRNDYQISWGAGLREDMRTLDRFWFSADLALDIFTIDNHLELQLRTGSIDHRILVGTDLQRHVNQEPFDFGTADPIDVFDPEYGQALHDPFFVSDVQTRQRQIGVYAQNELGLTERFTVLVSGRADRVATERLDRMAETTTSQDSDAFTGRIGAVYRTDAGFAPYASFASAFLPVIGSDAGGNPFEPERGRQTEVGLKFQPQGGDALLTLAAFDLIRSNVLTADPANPAHQAQTGEIRSRGIEIEGVATLLGGLDLTGAVTLLDAEITESNDGDQGNRPIIVPDWTAATWGVYTLHSGLPGLGVGVGLRYTGASWGDPQNSLEVPSFTLFDAALHYDRGFFGLSIKADNLFDDVHVVSCYGANSCFYGPTRTVNTTLRFRW